MKHLLFFLLLYPYLMVGQEEVPAKYWINDDSFEEVISPQGGFSDDDDEVIVVEFWAKFNSANAFPDWKKLDNLPGVSYFRVDIAQAPEKKKELRIRMAPTLLIYTRGDAYIKFKAKAGLDLLCPVDYDKMVRAIEVVKEESKF